jgi:hypothetical protein
VDGVCQLGVAAFEEAEDEAETSPRCQKHARECSKPQTLVAEVCGRAGTDPTDESPRRRRRG